MISGSLNLLESSGIALTLLLRWLSDHFGDPGVDRRITLRWIYRKCRSQRPRGLRRRSAAARLLRSWVRISPGAWIFVCCECCVLSGRGLCDELITRLEESYRLWCVVVCDPENLKNEEAMTRVGSQRHKIKSTGSGIMD